MKRLLTILATWLLLASSAWGAVQVETLNFVANTGSATTVVSTSFQAKGGMLWTHGKTTEGESAEAKWSFGVFDCTNVRMIAWAGDDAVATTNVGRGYSNTRGLTVYSNGGPVQATGGLISTVACNASDITITWNATPSLAWEVSGSIFGGADITNVFVGSDALPTGAGTESFTGAGFQPDFGIFLTGRATASPTDASHGYASVGVAASASEEWAWNVSVQDGQTVSGDVNGMSIIRNDACLIGQTITNGDDFIIDFTQWTSNGFDLNVSNPPPSAFLYAFILIKGGTWNTGVDAKPTGATTQDFVVGFTPKLLGFLMSSPTALNTYTVDAISTFGAWDGTTEVYAGAYHNDAVNSVAKSAGASTKVLRELNATAEADGTTLASTSVITWTATGTAFQTAWWAVGDNAGGSKGTISGAGTITGAGTIQ